MFLQSYAFNALPSGVLSGQQEAVKAMRETRQVVVALQHHFVRVGMLSVNTAEDATPNQGMTRWTSPR